MAGLASLLRVSLIASAVCLSLAACVFLGERAAPQYHSYQVKQGDTLYKIGWHYNVSVAELQRLNQIGRPERLQIGQVLKVPKRGQVLGPQDQPPRLFQPVAPKPQGEQTLAVGRITSPVIGRNRGRLLWPVPQGRIASRFGPRRNSFHEGVDIVAPSGTAILAAHDGVVLYSNNRMRGYGNMIAIAGEGVMTVYAHNRRNHVRPGQKVRRGQRIAEVGATGRTTTPHLHFEVRIKDKAGRYVAVDPMVFLESVL